MSELTIILGPMKSGKSFDLISHFAPLQYTDIAYSVYQSSRHVRDDAVWSRNGPSIAANKVRTLKPLLKRNDAVVGIDEVHMFRPADIEVLAELLRRGTRIIVSGLDMDYRGVMFGVIRRLLELAPHEVRYKRAVCEVCRKPQAVYTQITLKGEPVTGGLPSVIPEDGTVHYLPVCRHCFVRG